jgi:hypothetical protein
MVLDSKLDKSDFIWKTNLKLMMFLDAYESQLFHQLFPPKRWEVLIWIVIYLFMMFSIYNLVLMYYY